MPSPVKHLTLFSTDSIVMRSYFYHFYFTAIGAKAQRGMVLIILCPGTFLAINKWMCTKQIMDECNMPDKKAQDSGIKAPQNERVS